MAGKAGSDEREKTGINSLKVRYNKVFGYYIEVSKTHSEAVPPEYIASKPWSMPNGTSRMN